jgi:hypothetical protein
MSDLRLSAPTPTAIEAPITPNRQIVFVLTLLCSCVLTLPARAQQQPLTEDPEDTKQIGLWLDQTLSAGLSPNKSLETEVHERFDEGGATLNEYFFQGGIGFRLRPWLAVTPSYRYQRFPGNPNTDYENRLLLNFALSKPQGRWRPNLRTLIEGRFPNNRLASGRLRFRPGIDWVLPVRATRPPVLVVNNEFFLVPGNNPFSNGGSAYTQNRLQVGVRQAVTDYFSMRAYYMFQSVNLPTGWETNEIVGISLNFRVPRKKK